MFNSASFLHLSLMSIVVEHVVLLPANLHETLKLFHCLVASSTMVNIIHGLDSFQFSLLQLVFNTSIASTGLQQFNCINRSSILQLLQLLFNNSPASTGLRHFALLPLVSNTLQCFNWSYRQKKSMFQTEHIFILSESKNNLYLY